MTTTTVGLDNDYQVLAFTPDEGYAANAVLRALPYGVWVKCAECLCWRNTGFAVEGDRAMCTKCAPAVSPSIPVPPRGERASVTREEYDAARGVLESKEPGLYLRCSDCESWWTGGSFYINQRFTFPTMYVCEACH